MRNLFLLEKVLVLGVIGLVFVGVWISGLAGKILAPMLLLGLVYFYFHAAAHATKRARAQVAHVNNRFESAFDGTAIGIAYEQGESRPLLQVSANGQVGRYYPYQLRSVGLQDDRKGNFRSVLLMIKDGDRPEWLIHFKSKAEATKWKERITAFAESGGRA